MNTVKVLIGADIVPVKSNIQLFNESDSTALVGAELDNILKSSDFRIFNLETPVTDVLSPIKKSGPVHAAPESTIKGIKALNPSLLVLANNHIIDQGNAGAEHTVNILKQNSIPYIGIGKTDLERSKTYIFEKDGIKIGVYNCCEHEYCIFPEGEWGANGYDPLESFDAVLNLKAQCNYVVVLYHGGKEFFRYPSPDLIRVFRKFADKGADVIIAQHTHCIGCYEKYNDSLLVYGQGNFLFDDNDRQYDEYLNTGLLVDLSFSKNSLNYDFIPLVREKNHIRKADSNEQLEIINSFEDRSKKIIDLDYIKSEYHRKALEYLRGYILNMHAGSKIDTIILRLFLKLPVKIRIKYFKKTMAHLLDTKNYIACEAHRELVLEGLKELC